MEAAIIALETNAYLQWPQPPAASLEREASFYVRARIGHERGAGLRGERDAHLDGGLERREQCGALVFEGTICGT
jgi:hypothetical protein